MADYALAPHRSATNPETFGCKLFQSLWRLDFDSMMLDVGADGQASSR
jgi:hypothetical protein